MRKDKEYIFQLRKEGKSYRAIQQETGVSRGTLVEWFKDAEWSKHIASRNNTVNIEKTRDRVLKMNDARRHMLNNLYKSIEDEAIVEYEKYKRDGLFWAGLMVYAGEGDKRSPNLIRVSNTEFYLHTIFIKFAQTYLSIPLNRIKGAILIYPDHNESLCKEMWSNILGIPRENFHKTQVIQGKEKVKRLQYGVGMSIISSTALKKKLLKWLALAQDEKFEAGMV